jgi:septal ring factor EnvC (AmiA/AmiB activator)
VTALAALLGLLLAADPRAQLGTLQARERAAAAAAALLADQERSVLDGLEAVELAATTARRELQRAEGEQAAAELALQRAAAAEAEAAGRLAARVEALRPRLAARARMGRSGELVALLSAPSLAELVKRRWLLGHVLERDARLVAEARVALADRELARAARAGEAARLAAATASARERREQATARQEEREALLAALRRARSFQERAAAEAAGQARRLAAFVATLPPPRAGGGKGSGFAARRGKLPAPADGPVAVAFGKVVNPRFNTVTVQNGLDIEAPAGAPVHAVAPGRVVHAGWFKGYGNLVIVDHGGGYHTLVAHLATMRTAQGEDVEAGTVLGTVGDSGSLKGPYLYFELREKGRPVDPRPWLAE